MQRKYPAAVAGVPRTRADQTSTPSRLFPSISLTRFASRPFYSFHFSYWRELVADLIRLALPTVSISHKSSLALSGFSLSEMMPQAAFRLLLFCLLNDSGHPLPCVLIPPLRIQSPRQIHQRPQLNRQVPYILSATQRMF